MASTTLTIFPPMNGVDRRMSPSGGRMPGSCYYCLNVMPRQHITTLAGDNNAYGFGKPVNALGLRVRPPINTYASGAVVTTTTHKFFHIGNYVTGGNPATKLIYVGGGIIDLDNVAVPTGGGQVTTMAAATIGGTTYFPMLTGSTLGTGTGVAQWPLVSGAGTVAQMVATAGTVPTNCQCAVDYFGRLVLSGDTSNLGNIYLARANTPTDWDYSRRDAIAAVALNTSQAIGGVLDRIKALIQTKIDGLLVGGYRSMHFLRGNPADGGRLYVVTRDAGVLGQYTHCMDRRGYIYFVSSGFRLCRFNPGDMSVEDVSQGYVGALGRAISLVYDEVNDGVWIFGKRIDDSGLSPLAITEMEGDSSFSETATHCFYKINSGDGVQGFFPMEGPTSLANGYGDGAAMAKDQSIYISTTGITGVGFATIDFTHGYAGDLADTVAIKHGWHSWPVNPFQGGNSTLARTDLSLQGIQRTTAKNQASLKAFADAGETDVVLTSRHQQMLYASAAGGYTPGRQVPITKRVRGTSFSFRMSNVNAAGTAVLGAFELEKIEATFEPAGQSRRR